MNKQRQDIEKNILHFFRKKKIRDTWKLCVKIIPVLFPVSLVLIILSLSGFVFWWNGFFFLLFPVLIIIVYNYFKPINMNEFISELDYDVSFNQNLTAFYELIILGNTNHSYYNILYNRILEKFRFVKPHSIYFIQLHNKTKLAFILLLSMSLFSMYAFFYQPSSMSELAAEDIQQAEERLAVREDLKETFSTQIDQMQELEKELELEKERTQAIEESIENLRNEITKQLSSLRRDSLSSLIEEKKIDPQMGFNLNRLLKEEVELDESREFIMDLLSDDSISSNQKSYIQKSYEDYSSNPDTAETSKLGEDIIDSFSSELRDKSEAMQDAVDSLDNALEKLNSPKDTDMLTDGSGGSPGLDNMQDNNVDSLDGLDPEERASSFSPGKEKNQSGFTDGFEPLEDTEVKAYFPEGQIIINSDTGIVRMKADDELYLERIVSIYDSSPFEEGIIRDYNIPENMQNYVKDYFLKIGVIELED